MPQLLCSTIATTSDTSPRLKLPLRLIWSNSFPPAARFLLRPLRMPSLRDTKTKKTLESPHPALSLTSHRINLNKNTRKTQQRPINTDPIPPDEEIESRVNEFQGRPPKPKDLGSERGKRLQELPDCGGHRCGPICLHHTRSFNNHPTPCFVLKVRYRNEDPQDVRGHLLALEESTKGLVSTVDNPPLLVELNRLLPHHLEPGTQ